MIPRAVGYRKGQKGYRGNRQDKSRKPLIYIDIFKKVTEVTKGYPVSYIYIKYILCILSSYIGNTVTFCMSVTFCPKSFLFKHLIFRVLRASR